jgi:hypothetical protein
MPKLVFDDDEVEYHFDAKINKKSGLANVGRKYHDRRVVIVILKESKRV